MPLRIFAGGIESPKSGTKISIDLLINHLMYPFEGLAAMHFLCYTVYEMQEEYE